MPGPQAVREWSLAVAVMFMLCLPGERLAYGQTMSEDQIKAAYLYNFAKFVEWPAQDFATPGAPIRLCVWGNPMIESELGQIVKGKSIAGRPVSIGPVQNGEQSRTCPILFIDSSEDKQTRRILDSLRDRSVLTVGETESFVQQGGIISFVMQEDHVQFEVNHKTANQSGLHISSRLLSVARRVIE
jgi:hypothetical protein